MVKMGSPVVNAIVLVLPNVFISVRNCKVHKRNNKGKCNVPLFND